MWGGGYEGKVIINLFTDTVTTKISVEASPNTENRTTIQPAIHSMEYTYRAISYSEILVNPYLSLIT